MTNNPNDVTGERTLDGTDKVVRERRRWTFGAILFQMFLLTVVAAGALGSGYFADQRHDLLAQQRFFEQRLAAQERITALEKEVLELKLARAEMEAERATVIEVDLQEVFASLRKGVVAAAVAKRDTLTAQLVRELAHVADGAIPQGPTPNMALTRSDEAPEHDDASATLAEMAAGSTISLVPTDDPTNEPEQESQPSGDDQSSVHLDTPDLESTPSDTTAVDQTLSQAFEGLTEPLQSADLQPEIGVPSAGDELTREHEVVEEATTVGDVTDEDRTLWQPDGLLEPVSESASDAGLDQLTR